MANPERPKSRLPDGRVNPAYTAWRKANILDKPKATPAATSVAQAETLTLRCVKQAVNKRYVYCDLKGLRVAVKVKKGIGHRLVKKTIKVTVDRSGEQPVYTHVPR